MGKPVEDLITKDGYIRTGFGQYKFIRYDWKTGKVVIELPDGRYALIDPMVCRQADDDKYWVDEE